MGHLRLREVDRLREDYRKYKEFIVIPSYSSGEDFTIKRRITAPQLRRHWSPTSTPSPGEEYTLSLNPSPHFRVDWWNWGSLDGDLADKFLTDWPKPRSDSPEADLPPKNAVLPFACWEEDADDDGNTFVWLEIEWDKTPFKVKFESKQSGATQT
jgi:hypothetical protein